MEPLVQCSMDTLLASTVASHTSTTTTTTAACTALDPWYEHQGNVVTLQFSGLPAQGTRVKQGDVLVIQPPVGYVFSKPYKNVFEPLEGLPETSGWRKSEATVHAAPAEGDYASQQLKVVLGFTPPTATKLIVRVRVDNPPEAPVKNLWRASILDTNGVPLYTNDGDWQGFTLNGVLLQSDTNGVARTRVEALDTITLYPSYPNTVRLHVFLASPLRGRNLAMRVKAPAGFAFSKNCLPEDPDPLPRQAPTNPVSAMGQVSVTGG